MPANKKLLILPGDGIGPEVMTEVRRVVDWFDKRQAVSFDIAEDLAGGAAIDAHGTPLTDATMDKAMNVDAVLLGAVGGPKWDDLPFEQKPERGLLRLRKEQDGVKLTFKENLSTGLAKIMEEHETAVADFDVMRKILASLGYREMLSLRKNRAQFSLNGQHLVFDKYFDELAHIPEFLEIEAQSEEALLALMDTLGIEREQTLPWNTHDLMLHYQQK